MESRKAATAVIAIIICVAAALTARSFQDPITNDGALYPVMAQVIDGQIDHPHYLPHSAGIVPHPPLYQMSLALIAATLGSDYIYFRLFGVFCALLNCLLIWLNIRLVLHDRAGTRSATVLAIGVYLLNPFGRLGMLVTDIDYVVVTPTLLTACYLTIRYSRRPTGSNLLLVMLGQALALWGKLTSSLVFPFIVAVRLVWGRGLKRAILTAAAVGLGGLLIFAATWWLFCAIGNYPVLNLLRIIHVFHDKTLSHDKFLQLGRNVLGSLFWFGPAFLLVALLTGLHILVNAPTDPVASDLSIFVVYGWILFAVYLVVGGIAFTMPKYQYPVAALLSIPVAVLLTRMANLETFPWKTGAILFVCALGIQFVSGDPLYHLFGELRRDAYAAGQAIPVHDIRMLIMDTVLAALPILLCTIWAARARRTGPGLWLISLAIVMFAYDLGLGLVQARADYVTTYNYGTRGADQVIAAIRPRARVLVHEGAMYGLWNTRQIHYMDLPGDRITATGAELIEMIRAANPDYFVMGLALNTLPQLRLLNSDAALQDYFKSNYARQDYGDFILYERSNQIVR